MISAEPLEGIALLVAGGLLNFSGVFGGLVLWRKAQRIRGLALMIAGVVAHLGLSVFVYFYL